MAIRLMRWLAVSVCACSGITVFGTASTVAAQEPTCGPYTNPVGSLVEGCKYSDGTWTAQNDSNDFVFFAYPSGDAPLRIVASGDPLFLPYSSGSVPLDPGETVSSTSGPPRVAFAPVDSIAYEAVSDALGNPATNAQACEKGLSLFVSHHDENSLTIERILNDAQTVGACRGTMSKDGFGNKLDSVWDGSTEAKDWAEDSLSRILESIEDFVPH